MAVYLLVGRQKKVGLIDELGTFTDAVDYAAELVGITDDPDLIYPEVEGGQNIFERYLENTASRYLGGINVSVKQVIGPQYLWNAF